MTREKDPILQAWVDSLNESADECFKRGELKQARLAWALAKAMKNGERFDHEMFRKVPERLN